ncbi:MAG: hypothetical protein GX817_07260, partial [Elusimicrobia bacterium]|nr:hypothetical protein [Elusimicrobiota bacterium]
MKNTSKWIDENAAEFVGKKILYLCMEMLMPEMGSAAREANFNGGLGILAGDTMEGMHTIGADVSAVIPMYKYNWEQRIKNGRQDGAVKEVNYTYEPIEEVQDSNGEPLVIEVTFEGRNYPVAVYKLIRAGIPVYLLRNGEVFDILYTGDRKQRLRQEVVIGKVVPLLLDALNLSIDALHLNEAHTISAACFLKERKEYADIPVVFTTHTPVPAGMEKYPVDWFSSMDLPHKYLQYFQNGNVIDFTRAAIHLSCLTNGVSKEHGEVTKNMFLTDRNKIFGIINGSSPKWQIPELREADEVTPEFLWTIHKSYKKKALEDASWRAKEYLGMDISYDLKKPTAGMFRRLADYKQQYPMFKDIVRAVCGDRDKLYDTPYGKLEGLGIQLFAGGIAHPADSERQEWIKHFVDWSRSDELRGRFTFLTGYGMRMLTHGARGYDFWISTPRKNMEACGTSDQRAALNGNLNICAFTGGAREYMTEIDPDTLEGSALFLDPYGPETLYRKLEYASKLYYDCVEKTSDAYKKIMYNVWKDGMEMTVDTMAKKYVL